MLKTNLLLLDTEQCPIINFKGDSLAPEDGKIQNDKYSLKQNLERI